MTLKRLIFFYLFLILALCANSEEIENKKKIVKTMDNFKITLPQELDISNKNEDKDKLNIIFYRTKTLKKKILFEAFMDDILSSYAKNKDWKINGFHYQKKPQRMDVEYEKNNSNYIEYDLLKNGLINFTFVINLDKIELTKKSIDEIIDSIEFTEKEN